MPEGGRFRLAGPFTHDGGHAYVTEAPRELIHRSGPLTWSDPELVLLEDGRVLPKPVESHEEIRLEGMGRYSLWGEEVYVSATDSSDVTANGRVYELTRMPRSEAALARHRDDVRIGFVGNINNIQFSLAEATNALGVEAYLYPVHPGMLHDPASKLTPGASLPPWVRRVAELEDRDLFLPSSVVDALVEDIRRHCDFVVLNGGLVPSLARRIDLPFAFFETGSDVTFYANFEAVATVAGTWAEAHRYSLAGRDELLALTRAVALQRDAILGAAVVSGYQPRGFIPEMDAVFDEVGLDDSLRLPYRAADLRRIAARPVPGSPAEGEGLIAFSPVRIDFTGSFGDSALDDKGTGRLLEGFATFLQRGGRGRLRLVRKGHDIEEAEALVGRLGISDEVEFVHERPVAEYLELIASAHLVCEAISPAGPAGITHDALASGRPVLGNLRPDVFEPFFGGEGYPGFHVETADDVANGLMAAYELGGRFGDLGARARAFAEEHLSPDRFIEQKLGWILDRAFLPGLARSRGEAP